MCEILLKELFEKMEGLSKVQSWNSIIEIHAHRLRAAVYHSWKSDT